eukprot:gene59437-81363_t
MPRRASSGPITPNGCSTRHRTTCIQVDSAAELGELAARLKAAGNETFDQEATTCCYALSDKSWVTDPAGVRWESFFTHGDATAYGEDEVIPDA